MNVARCMTLMLKQTWLQEEERFIHTSRKRSRTFVAQRRLCVMCIKRAA
jgi:hypothetical protein